MEEVKTSHNATAEIAAVVVLTHTHLLFILTYILHGCDRTEYTVTFFLSMSVRIVSSLNHPPPDGQVLLQFFSPFKYQIRNSDSSISEGFTHQALFRFLHFASFKRLLLPINIREKKSVNKPPFPI